MLAISQIWKPLSKAVIFKLELLEVLVKNQIVGPPLQRLRFSGSGRAWECAFHPAPGGAEAPMARGPRAEGGPGGWARSLRLSLLSCFFSPWGTQALLLGASIKDT